MDQLGTTRTKGGRLARKGNQEHHVSFVPMRKLQETYFKNDDMDRLNKGLMTLASYNAGPGKIRSLRKETASRGLDPNVWFNNVERVVAEKIGRETVTSVSNIYKYYVAYSLTMEELKAKAGAKTTTS